MIRHGEVACLGIKLEPSSLYSSSDYECSKLRQCVSMAVSVGYVNYCSVSLGGSISHRQRFISRLGDNFEPSHLPETSRDYIGHLFASLRLRVDKNIGLTQRGPLAIKVDPIPDGRDAVDWPNWDLAL